MEKLPLIGTNILIVEDDPGIINLLKAFLLSKGATVNILENGKLVMQFIEQFKPDLVLLDIVIPYQDGFTILDKLRKAGNTIPIILLTDKNSIDDKVKGLGYGADDYMTKPFSTRELVARIQNVLRRSGAVLEDFCRNTFSVGDLLIKERAREVVLKGGENLSLTKTEFDLFCYLVKNRGQAVTHTTLLSEVMGYKGDVETKALVMHIANIRRKMTGSQVKNVAIETVAGVGYKISVQET